MTDAGLNDPLCCAFAPAVLDSLRPAMKAR
jgi:hypothetical protein